MPEPKHPVDSLCIDNRSVGGDDIHVEEDDLKIAAAQIARSNRGDRQGVVSGREDHRVLLRYALGRQKRFPNAAITRVAAPISIVEAIDDERGTM